MTRAWMSWSSGKDSAFALAAARQDLGLDVTALLVTMNADADRVAMHAVRRALLEAQAERLDLPLHIVEIPSPCTNAEYESRMRAAIAAARHEGVEAMIFGDLFLEDVRAYRETNLAGTGIAPVFPLWGRPTAELARAMIDRGVGAVLTCVDPQKLPAGYAGRAFDHQLLADLPPEIDPCGERGEFHTFVWNGPGFREPIAVETGARVTRDGFVFCDVVPQDQDDAAGVSRF